MDPNTTAPGAELDGRFLAGNPYSSPRRPSTAVTAKFLNSVRAELGAVLTAAGITPSEYDDAQLLAALRSLYVLGLPPAQKSFLASNGPSVWDPELSNGWRSLPGMPYVGAWSAGNTNGTPPPSPYYEEATGEYYNCVGVQANTGGIGVRTLDARTADDGPWIPQEWLPPDGVLVVDVYGRIKQADAGAARTFYQCIDFNGDCTNKQNSWGSDDAIVFTTSVAANAYPNLIPFHWRTVMVATDVADQLWMSRLEVFGKTVISGNRLSSVAADIRQWGLDKFSGTGWNFSSPSVAAGHVNHRGNTMLGLRWAVSGTQNNTARLIVHTVDAKVSSNRWG